MDDVDEISDFFFYLGFTKELVLNLPDPRDRPIAASWLKKLREIDEKNDKDNTVHIEYLKLLLIAMHGNNFSSFFEKLPPEGNLEPININEIILAIKEAAKSRTPYPFVYTSVSGDFCDFVAIQEIPNYGLQGYYATSTEPLSNWIHTKSVCSKRSVKDPSEKLLKETKGDGNTDSEKRMSPTAPSKEPIRNLEMEIAEESENQSKTSIHGNKDDSSAQRKELIGIETRPCWGTNRYIERLIDESPHFTSDLGLVQADAFLHNFKDWKMKKIKKVNTETPCLLSSKRRQVERMMDLPRCAIDAGDEDISPNASKSKRINFTCRPKEQKENNFDCFDPCAIEDDEDEDCFYQPEWESQKNRNIKPTKNRIQNKIRSYANSYFPENRSQQKPARTLERSVEKNYSSRQEERGHSEDAIYLHSEFLPRTTYSSSIHVEPRIPEKTITLDASNISRANVSLPPQSSNINSQDETVESFMPLSDNSSNFHSRLATMASFGPDSELVAENDVHSRHETMGSFGPTENELDSQCQSMGSYGPVSGFTSEFGISNYQNEDFEVRSRNFVTLQSDNSGQRDGSRRRQQFVSLKNHDDEDGNENNSWENLVSNPSQSNSRTGQRRDALPRRNRTLNDVPSPKRDKLPNQTANRSF